LRERNIITSDIHPTVLTLKDSIFILLLLTNRIMQSCIICKTVRKRIVTVL